MNKKTKLGLIALSLVGGAIGVGIGEGIKKMKKTNAMNRVMFTVSKSKLNFEETVAAISESAIKHGWEIPSIFDLQQHYKAAGHEDMTRVKIIYFCNPHGGYRILQDDNNKPMSVLMPTGVSVYKTNDGQVCIAGMNLGLMNMMFGGTAKEVFKEGGENFAKTLENIIEKQNQTMLGRIGLGSYNL